MLVGEGFMRFHVDLPDDEDVDLEELIGDFGMCRTRCVDVPIGTTPLYL